VTPSLTKYEVQMPSDISRIIHGRVNVQIGKNGISEGVITQIKEQFKKNRYLKIRFLELYMFDSMRDASQMLANQVNGKVIDIRGKTVVLERIRTQE